MYTYELTPNLKTKSYRVLDNGVEIARSLAKKTAKVFCDTYNQLLNQLENNEIITSDHPTDSTNSTSKEQPTSYSTDIRDNQIESYRDRERVSRERSEYFANALQQLSTSVNACGEIAKERGRRAEEHGRRAEEHGRRAEEHGRRAEEWDRIHKRLVELNDGIDPGDAEFGTYINVPYQLNHEAGSLTVPGQDDYLEYRTIDTSVI